MGASLDQMLGDSNFQSWASDQGYTMNQDGSIGASPYMQYILEHNQQHPEEYQPIRATAEPVTRNDNGDVVYNPLYNSAKRKVAGGQTFNDRYEQKLQLSDAAFQNKADNYLTSKGYSEGENGNYYDASGNMASGAVTQGAAATPTFSGKNDKWFRLGGILNDTAGIAGDVARIAENLGESVSPLTGSKDENRYREMYATELANGRSPQEIYSNSFSGGDTGYTDWIYKTKIANIGQ